VNRILFTSRFLKLQQSLRQARLTLRMIRAAAAGYDLHVAYMKLNTRNEE